MGIIAGWLFILCLLVGPAFIELAVKAGEVDPNAPLITADEWKNHKGQLILFIVLAFPLALGIALGWMMMKGKDS